jgi:hypothetical protein
MQAVHFFQCLITTGLLCTELNQKWLLGSRHISAFNRDNDRNIVDGSGYVRLDSDWVPLRTTGSCRHEVFVIINAAVDGYGIFNKSLWSDILWSLSRQSFQEVFQRLYRKIWVSHRDSHEHNHRICRGDVGWPDMSKFLLYSYHTESHFRDYSSSKKRLHEGRNCGREGNFIIVLRKTVSENVYCIDLVRIVFSRAIWCWCCVLPSSTNAWNLLISWVTTSWACSPVLVGCGLLRKQWIEFNSFKTGSVVMVSKFIT